MKKSINFISSKKVISIIIIIFLCGMLVAKTRGNRFPENGTDNRSVPNLIDYQGKITDDSSNPITDPVSIVFAIYDIDTGGTALWTETHLSVTPVDGLVHVLLGSETTFGDDLFDGSDRWLSINVNGDGEMTPRLRIVSVPYSIHAKTADTDNDWTINGSDMYSAVSGDVGIGTTTPGYKLDVDGEINISSESAYKIDGEDILQNRGTKNIFVGGGAGNINTGHSNAFMGVAAGAFNTSGKCNVFLGKDSGLSNTTGCYNSYFGSFSGYLSTGKQNIFVGSYSGYNTTGSNNVFLGMEAGYDETGSDKLYIESSRSSTPLIYGEFDSDKIVINGDFQATGITRDSGGDAGTSGQVLSTTGTGTDWIDATDEINDLTDGKTGGYSVFLGSYAGLNDNGANNANVGFGLNALYANISGVYNTANGYNALHYNTGSYNTAFGSSALLRNTTGGYNVGIGYQVNNYNQTGSQNTIIGYMAGRGTSNHSKSGNVFLEYKAGYDETGSNKLYIENSDVSTPLIYGEFDTDKIVINGDFQATGITRDSGGDAGTSGQVLSTTGTGTDWVDEISGDGHSLDAADGDPTDVVYVDNEGDVRIGNGTSTLYKLDVDGNINISTDNAYKINGQDILHNEGTGNLFTGVGAGENIVGTGTYNTFIGNYSGYDNTTADYNTFLGYGSGYFNSTGSNNSFIGFNSGTDNTTGDQNTFLGTMSGRYNSTGSYNTYLGKGSGLNSTGSGNIFLGCNAGYDETGDNKLYIENSDSSSPLIYGEFDNDLIKINGEFQANSTSLYAGYFKSNYNSDDTHVIHAEYTGTGNYTPTAVYGKSRPTDGYGCGGWFEGGYMGIYGKVTPTGSDVYVGIYGYLYGGSGTNYGIYGTAGGGSINYAGYFNGNVHVTGTFTNPSDERFKENVQPFKNALSKIKLMNVHTFNFKQMEEEKQLVLPEGEQIGLIAQELEEILPELVVENVHAYDKNEGIEGAERDMEKIEYKGINYIGLIPVLIEAMKEQQQQIEELKQQIAELK